MLIARWIVVLLLVGGLVCLAMYFATGEARFRFLGLRIIRYTVVAALGFFAVLILERLATFV